MDTIVLIVGLFMIGIGFLVKAVPNLIAGYNTLSKAQKENVNIEGLSSFLRKGFIIIGLSIIVDYFLSKWIGLTLIANSMILIVTIVGVFVLVIMAQRFDHREKKQSKIIYIVLGLVLLLVVGQITYGSMSSKTTINNDSIRFSGMYGFELNLNEIQHIELLNQIPTINKRTNGFSFWTIKKGTYNLDQFGNCRLLIHSDMPPYLLVSKKSGDKIIINFKDSCETVNLYSQIKTRL